MNQYRSLAAQGPFSALRPARIMIYSHDTFGLGHIRRARAIANAIVGADSSISIIIVTGSPVVGNFEYADGIDYVRLPGVVKQADGDYASLSLRVSLEESVALREALIRQTAISFDPDILIVDKEPTGFRGEVLPTLEFVKARGTRVVLGVRDILDEPEALIPEWERKGAGHALVQYYDNVVVYGLKEVYEPLACLNLPASVAARTTYTGYLRREMPREPNLTRYPKLTKGDFVLVTTGGGGDGAGLMDWVISAYETHPTPEIPALLVFGPFIPRDRRRAFMERVARLKNVDAISFDAKLERLMDRAAGVVAMGGYNTFCEILSLDKRALIVPRATPRLEQTIRARRAAALGLCSMLEDPTDFGRGRRDPAAMAAAISAMLKRGRPSEAQVPSLLGGLETIVSLTRRWMEPENRRLGARYPVQTAAQ
jgi:predicted glycosyltransferase